MSTQDANALLEATRRKAQSDRNHELRAGLQLARGNLALMLEAFIQAEPDADIKADAIRMRNRAVMGCR